jgi:hypothetical protein
VAVVATWLASVGLAGWIAPIASWSVLAAGVLSLSVEVDVRPGHATFERRLLGVVMTRREIGACAADREVPWLWMTFDGDDFVFPTRCGQPQPTDPVAPIELLFTVADAEAPDADELDRAIRRILREPTRS